jgi:hypothetical protein
LDAVNVLEGAVNVLESSSPAGSATNSGNGGVCKPKLILMLLLKFLGQPTNRRGNSSTAGQSDAGRSGVGQSGQTIPRLRPGTIRSTRLSASRSAAAGLGSGASRSGIPSVAPSTSGVRSELGNLFSWNAAASHGSRKKGRGKQPMGSSSASYKKKKLKTWSHTFMCLAKVNQSSIPDARERQNLKLAGLGEKKFSVMEHGRPSELQYEFFREYPKLEDGGGFELLRASDTGGKDLVPIDIPHQGYSVEYLQAIVKTAKIYIRPLQRNLDASVAMDEVIITCMTDVSIAQHNRTAATESASELLHG